MQRQRYRWKLMWSCVLGLSSAGMGALLAPDLPGSVAVASTAALTEWQFDPDTQQLEVVVPESSTPRYFLLAQPARIVLDLPNTEVGTTVIEQSYGGAVRRVRIAQFEPGVTRIVLELTPDAVLAPGQAELSEVESLPGGTTRWTLRPLLAGEVASAPNAPDESAETIAAASDPLVEEPAAAAVTETADSETEDDGAIAPAPEPPPPSAIPELDSPTSNLGAEPTMPMPAPEASVPTAEPALPSSQPDPATADARPGAAPVTVPSPATSEESAGGEEAEGDNSAPLGTEESPLISQGAAFLQTEPASIPLIQSSVSDPDAAAMAEVAPAPDASIPDASVAIAPEDAANAIEIPIDFPTPTELPSEAAATPTGLPPADGELLPDAPASPTVTVPPVATDTAAAAAEPAPSAEAVAAASVDPAVLIPAGTTLRLRYPRTTPLVLEAGQVWQEVLVVDVPIEDGQGNVLLPVGSQVLGRFEAEGQGHRFVAQAIALEEQIIPLAAASEPVQGEREMPLTIRPDQVIPLAVEQDVRRTDF